MSYLKRAFAVSILKMPIILSRLLLILFTSSFSFSTIYGQRELPKSFVYIKDVIPNAKFEIRYAGQNNFVGDCIKGYEAPVAILSKRAADALLIVQNEVYKQGFSIKIFDAYRPQMAVDHFVKWSKKANDTLAKSSYYPNIPKNRLFALGYIASRSGHTRGSTLDLTLVNNETGEEIDMGSSYDFFGEISHHNTSKITAQQKKNRQLLMHVMMKHGFRPYKEEWWHYSFRNEPFPNTYFNFPVK